MTALADDSIKEWASSLLAADARAFMEARRRFMRSPSTKRLHAIRSAARRLTGAFDDFRDIAVHPKRKKLRDLIALTGIARDAAVLRATLRAALDTREREAAKPMLRMLRERERDHLARVKNALRKIRYEK